MIKINLVKTRVSNAGGAAGAGAPIGNASDGAFSGMSFPSSSSGGLDAKETLIKLVVIFGFVGAIWAYEGQNIRTLQAQVSAQMAQAQDLERRVQAKDKEVEGIKDLERQSRELEDKLKILKLLSKLRLREVKTLDFVQSSIPEKVWLRTMNYEAEKDNMEAGHFNFVGLATSTEELTEFVKRLEDSAYLAEVIVMKNQETAAPGNSKSVLRDYAFTAQVEVQK